MIDLMPMTAEEYARFLAESVQGFAQKQVESGTWSVEEAPALARAEYDKLLPAGLATPDHVLRNIVAGPAREHVGTVWWAIRRGPRSTELFVYWVGIDEPHRRRGFASELFGRLDEEAAHAGASRIALHVFGSNVGARSLYEKLGFKPTHLLMVRSVRSSPDGSA